MKTSDTETQRSESAFEDKFFVVVREGEFETRKDNIWALINELVTGDEGFIDVVAVQEGKGFVLCVCYDGEEALRPYNNGNYSAEDGGEFVSRLCDLRKAKAEIYGLVIDDADEGRGIEVFIEDRQGERIRLRGEDIKAEDVDDHASYDLILG
ncbi:hypothetical protein [Bradyrhizobium elkanii]|uniref:hypothetical protein n=1 Tax=Bradyrhizobium elkanii TaxID=29448 RepID=UPI003517C5E6